MIQYSAVTKQKTGKQEYDYSKTQSRIHQLPNDTKCVTSYYYIFSDYVQIKAIITTTTIIMKKN